MYKLQAVTDNGFHIGAIYFATEDEVSDVRNGIRASFPVGSSWTVRVRPVADKKKA